MNHIKNILLALMFIIVLFLAKQNYTLGQIIELQAHAMQNHEDRLVDVEYKLNLGDN